MEKAINQMIDCPKSYLIQYYDDLKSKVDLAYETKLQEITDAELKEKTTKQWIKLIDVIEICLAKCINNTLPNELITQAKEILMDIESKQSDELEQLEHKLQSHLLSNEQCLAIFTRDQRQILIVEEGLSAPEIEWLV